METTERAIVDAGVALLESDGIAAVGVRSVAARVGLSHGAPRRYFPTRNALLAAIAREGVQDLDRELREGLDVGVAEAAVRYWRFSRRRTHMFALMFRHDLLDGAGGQLREVTGTWLPALTERIGDARRAVEVFSAVHGLCALAATGATDVAGLTVDDDYIRRFVGEHSALRGAHRR